MMSRAALMLGLVLCAMRRIRIVLILRRNLIVTHKVKRKELLKALLSLTSLLNALV